MPNQLPKAISQVKALSPRAKLFATQFPNIYRIIPESIAAISKYLALARTISICLISIYLLTATIAQFNQLQNNREQIKNITLKRNSIKNEIIYWQKITNEFKNYSDAYLKIASLEYNLGNTQIAKNYIDKALSINPNLESGRVLGERISR